MKEAKQTVIDYIDTPFSESAFLIKGPGDRVPRSSKPEIATGKLVNVTIYRVALRMFMRPSPLVEKKTGVCVCVADPRLITVMGYRYGSPALLWPHDSDVVCPAIP